MTAPTAEVRVHLEVTMTPEEFEKIRRAADWDGMTINDYLVAHALGKTRKGC